jgi:hypothetical protein
MREGILKRLVTATALAFAIAGLSASAAFGFSANFDYTGNVRGNPTTSVGFSVKHPAGGHKQVVGFTIAQVPYSCSDAPSGTTTGWRFHERMRVQSDRTFAGSGDWIGQPLDPVGSVSGKLRRAGVAVGDFRIRGELGGPGTHCRTGLLDWRATEQQPLAQVA